MATCRRCGRTVYRCVYGWPAACISSAHTTYSIVAPVQVVRVSGSLFANNTGAIAANEVAEEVTLDSCLFLYNGFYDTGVPCRPSRPEINMNQRERA